MKNDYTSALIQEIRSHGITDERVDRHGSNLKLRFTFRGRKLMFAYPRTPSDWRGLQNSLCDLRHMMGVTRAVRKSVRPKSTRKVPRRAVPVMTKLSLVPVAPLPDPWALRAPLAIRLRADKTNSRNTEPLASLDRKEPA